MKLSALLAPLVEAKADHETIMKVVLAFEAEHADALEQRRQADAERQARKRERDKSRDVTLRHSDSILTRGRNARVEDKTSSSEIEPQEKKITPLSRLEVVLDAERARSVVEHRQRIRKPLTEHAAKLLADKFAQCPDPNAAADTMVSNGWQGFEPGWLDKPNARGSPVNAPSQADVFAFIARNSNADEPEPPEDSSGVRQAIPHLSAVGSG